MSYKNWTLDIDKDGIAWLCIDKADGGANVLSGEVLRELHQLIEPLAKAPPKGVVIHSGKSNGFVMGADINEFGGFESAEQVAELGKLAQGVFLRIRDLPCPTVAVINGVCLGGGLELAAREGVPALRLALQAKGVDYGKLTAVLINALQELKAENERLAERVADADDDNAGRRGDVGLYAPAGRRCRADRNLRSFLLPALGLQVGLGAAGRPGPARSLGRSPRLDPRLHHHDARDPAGHREYRRAGARQPDRVRPNAAVHARRARRGASATAAIGAREAA